MILSTMYETAIAEELVNQYHEQLDGLTGKERTNFIKEIVREEFVDLAYDMTNTDFIRNVIQENTGKQCNFNFLSPSEQTAVRKTFVQNVSRLVYTSYRNI